MKTALEAFFMSGLDFGCAGVSVLLRQSLVCNAGTGNCGGQHITSIQFIAIWRHIIAIQSSMAAGKFDKNL